MSSPFLGEIMMVPYNFAPLGWAFCDGQILPISQNTALFSLLGTFYGGNGTSNFALPDFQSRVPVGAGQGPGLSEYLIGDAGGEINDELLTTTVPTHTHVLLGSTLTGTTASPGGSLPAVPNSAAKFQKMYVSAGNQVNMSSAAILPAGGSQPHNNLMPYLVISFVIALQGIFPPRS